MKQFIIISPDNKQHLVNADILKLWGDFIYLNADNRIVCVIPRTHLVIETNYKQIVD
jgi:hypothetical protein